ncbi:MAG: twin-arginine translocase subunit TatC [Defluviitaleaceae bacterium]|nr:twin-arginine translocase subunit TatC [Defluviitaleaceae bacterium]
MPSPEDLSRKESLRQHLRELKKVFMVSLVAIGIAFVAVFLFASEQLVIFFQAPLIERNVDIIQIRLGEAFLSQLRVSLVAAIVLASPVIFWKIWSFLRPALFPNERATFRLTFVVVVFLFVLGVLFSYMYVFAITVDFFLMMGEEIALPFFSVEEYLRTLFRFVIPFGLAFQLPVVTYVLHRMKIVTLEGLKKNRKYVIFGMFVLATLITPPDVLSQIMLALPLILLYEISIIVIRFTSRKTAENAENEVDNNDS